MKALGIDIGSRFIKAVLVEGGRVSAFRKEETSFDPLGKCSSILESMCADFSVATGYGRALLGGRAGVEAITEIKAFASGARAMLPSARTVIDIGGQDTKVISLDASGAVTRFEMNDRCAAGTGKFLEVMARVLGYGIEEFGGVLYATASLHISSMCTVFAESEVVSLIAKGASRQEIAVAIHSAIAGRVTSMLARTSTVDDVVFLGGCANNVLLRVVLEKASGKSIVVPAAPEMAGALGAAIHAEARLKGLEPDSRAEMV